MAVANGTGLAVRVEMADAARLSPRQGIACYRIIQKAMTNALRHSCCRRFEIIGSAEEDACIFVIEDDCQGLSEEAGAKGHFGMCMPGATQQQWLQ